jgi:hypothetical protein
VIPWIEVISKMNHHPRVTHFSTGLRLKLDDSSALTFKEEEAIIDIYLLSSLIKFIPGH